MAGVPLDIEEYEEIAIVMQVYLDAAEKGDGAICKDVFHPAATMFGLKGGELVITPIAGLFDRITQIGASPQIRGQITSIDVSGSIATARVESDNWADTRYTDMFTLLKTGQGWKIMNKVFHIHQK